MKQYDSGNGCAFEQKSLKLMLSDFWCSGCQDCPKVLYVWARQWTFVISLNIIYIYDICIYKFWFWWLVPFLFGKNIVSSTMLTYFSRNGSKTPKVLATCYAYSAGISIAGVPSSDPVLGIHKILLRMPYWCPPVFQPDSSLNLLFVDSTARMWHQFRRTMVPAHWPWPPKKDQRKDVTNDCSPARDNKDQAEGWKGQKMIIQWNLTKIQQFQRTSFCGASLKRDLTITCIGQSEPCI